MTDDVVGPCAPHASVTVRGWCYGHIKVRIEEGRKVDQEQAEFAGFVSVSEPDDRELSVDHWLQPVNPRTTDDRLDSLAELMDRAPNYLEFARRILEDDGEKSK